MADQPQESMEDFGALLDAQMDAYHKGFNPGEQVTGTVTVLGSEHVVVDLNAKNEGIVARKELEDESGELTVKVGDSLTAYFLAMSDGAFLLSTSLAGAASLQSLREAVEKHMPVEGVVKSEINGGYEVTVAGERAFCPYSQMDIHRKEAADYIGCKLNFLVSEFDPQEKNVVLSRRELQERERLAQRDELVKTLKEGDLRQGVVCRLQDFGAFVDLGGVDGLIPLHELTWDRKLKAEDIVHEGQAVTVSVLKIDWEQNRISLSLRQAQGDPWDAVNLNFPPGTTVPAIVTRLASFGAFAELEPGVEGLIHISKLGHGRRLQHAREAVSEGQELEVEVESVDLEQRRIGLKLVDDRMRALADSNTIAPGSRVTGRVEGHRDFGIFVRLNEEQTGLLHISETRLPRGGSPAEKLTQAYPLASEIEVVVKALDGDRVSLTLPEVWEEHKDEAEMRASDYIKRTPSSGLGSMGDALDGLSL